VRWVVAIVIAIVMGGTLASAEIAPPNKTRADCVAALTEWARGPQGRDNRLQFEIVRLFGLGCPLRAEPGPAPRFTDRENSPETDSLARHQRLAQHWPKGMGVATMFAASYRLSH
jgi:hypothetical protein